MPASSEHGRDSGPLPHVCGERIVYFARTLAESAMPIFTAINYGQLASRYDESRRAEPAIVGALVKGLRSLGARSVLEIGAGTGNYTGALVAEGLSVTALDRSPAMIEIGAEKASARWILSDALALPFRAHAVDAIAGVNVLHHLPRLSATLAEFRRVARVGVVFQVVVRESLESLWYRHYFPAIDEVLSPLHPTLGSLITRMFHAGFSRVAAARIFYSGLGDLTFEAARTRPHLLFDPAFRASTSGFRRLKSADIARGLAELERDLDSGAFAQIAAPFDAAYADSGDCVVISAI
jgi:ubiquinone/menaquinone biosynthesis C-methylase UbiE